VQVKQADNICKVNGIYCEYSLSHGCHFHLLFSDIHSHFIGKQPHLSFPRHGAIEPVPGERVISCAPLGTCGPELPGMLSITGWPTEGTPCQTAVDCNNLITNPSGTQGGKEATEAQVHLPQTAGR